MNKNVNDLKSFYSLQIQPNAVSDTETLKFFWEPEHIKKFTVQKVTCWQLALGSVKYQCTLMELGVNEVC